MAYSQAYNTIKLKKYLNIIEEYEAEAAIIPGELIQLNSSGNVEVHDVAGGNSLHMFALEDELQGNGINDAYADGDQVQVWIPTRGDQVYAILADGEDVAIGDFLESNGSGELQKHTPDSFTFESADSDDVLTVYSNQIVGVSLEDIDLSGSSGEESSEGGFDSSTDPLGYNRRIVIRIK